MIFFMIVILLCVIAAIDMKKGIIPWQLLLLMLLLISYQYIVDGKTLWIPFLYGGVMGVFLHSLRLVLNTLYQKDTLGMGDIHLMMVITYLFSSIEYSLYVIVIASYIALFVMLMLRKKQLPFGPFIMVSTIGVMIYQIFFI